MTGSCARNKTIKFSINEVMKWLDENVKIVHYHKNINVKKHDNDSKLNNIYEQ